MGKEINDADGIRREINKVFVVLGITFAMVLIVYITSLSGYFDDRALLLQNNLIILMGTIIICVIQVYYWRLKSYIIKVRE